MQIGNYEVVSLLGEGAFGRTFKGKHVILGSPACIKQEKTGKKPYTDLFRDEAAIIARLKHPSLPSFMDYQELPKPIGQVLVISFAEGTPLDKLVETETTPEGDLIAQKPVDDEHACWIIDRILSPVSYLHGRWRIVHCDLKPGNVIVDVPDHNATVVDLGMASYRPDEWSKAKGGTPGYLPPEFGGGLPPVPASDIYSIGKIACSITGGNVFKGEFPEDMHPELREFFETWIRQDPTQRPQNVERLRAELAKLRRDIFGRSSTKEEFKYRSKKRGGKR